MLKRQLVMKYIYFLTLIFLSIYSKAQVTITASHTASSMAQMLAGQGITISNAFYSGTCDSSVMAGKFQVTGPSPFGLSDSGIVLTSGDVFDAVGPSAVASTSFQKTGDADLAILSSPQSSNDACVLEFDLIPTGDTIKFKYIFASAEYQTYSCSIADVFGFFISGPGITGTFSNSSKNIALLPNGCYVGVNTVNGQTSNPCGNATGICSPPNNALFVNNLPIGNTTAGLSYNGFTQPLFAVSAVQPCSTYHLKLAISDASDWILDSGVFLEAGSLSSNSISFSASTFLNKPEPYVVEGCASGGVIISRPVATPFPYTVTFLIGGNAINGVDYVNIPPSATIPAGQTSVIVPIIALQDGLAEGAESVVLYRQAQCDTTVIDSAIVFIYDSLQFTILTPDTAICLYDSVHILTLVDSLCTITWSNIPYINNITLFDPTVSPFVTSTYIATIALPNSGCQIVSKPFTVTVNTQPSVKIGPDITICKNMQYAFNPIITPTQNYTYQWTPTTFLNNANTLNPIGTFTAVGTYTYFLKVSPTAQGCAGYDTIVIRVLPNDIVINTPDTIVCEGAVFPITVTGDNNFSYLWVPNTFLNFDNVKSPLCTPYANTNYTLTASYPGCPDMVKTINLEVQPVPVINLGPDRFICKYDTAQLGANIVPASYPNYTHTWLPTTSLNAANLPIVEFNGLSNATYTYTVNTPIGCLDEDTITVNVYPGDFAAVTPTYIGICPNNTVKPVVTGGGSYFWQPSYFMVDSTLSNPTIYPTTSVVYTIMVQSNDGCWDTVQTEIYVANAGILELGPDFTMYPGDVHQFLPLTNCVNFNWAPATYLSATNIINPTITSPLASQQYIVTATNDFGCAATDTIIMTVSNESLIGLPKAFTPGNGNSPNNVFKLDKRGIATLNAFRIYNRWGELVFETKDVNIGWDGNYKGKPEAIGTYIYAVDAVDPSGKKFNRTGNVSLIR